MNPRTPTGRGLKDCSKNNRDIINYREIREDFMKWLRMRTSEDYTKQLVGYLDRFVKNRVIKDPKDLIDIIEKSTSKKNMILALRNIVNYCEELRIISLDKSVELKKVLKCVKSNVDGYVPSDDEVIEAFTRFDDENYRLVFKLIAFSGLRIREVVRMLNNFDKRRLMINGDIAKYPLFDERSTKKVFFAYMPKHFALELKRIKVTEQGIKNYFYRRGLPAKYLRKWNYNFLILNGVPESVADFIQGRASITVGSMHYLAKVKQADEWYSRVVDKLLKLLG